MESSGEKLSMPVSSLLWFPFCVSICLLWNLRSLLSSWEYHFPVFDFASSCLDWEWPDSVGNHRVSSAISIQKYFACLGNLRQEGQGFIALVILLDLIDEKDAALGIDLDFAVAEFRYLDVDWTSASSLCYVIDYFLGKGVEHD